MRLYTRHRRGQDITEVVILIGFMLAAMLAFTAAVPQALQAHYRANRVIVAGPF